MVDTLAVARAHEHTWLRRQATAVTPVRVDGTAVGELVLTATVPRVRDHNAVVLGPCPQLEGATVLDLLDRELGAHDFTHRRLYAEPADADRWESTLVARGYERSDTVVMTWTGGDLGGAEDVDVVEADRTATAEVVRTILAVDHDEGAAIVDQLVALASAQHDLGVRVLVARVDGRPVGAFRLFPGDDVAQLEELQVLPTARGRGVGRALVAAGLRAAGDAGLVFLTSDPDDWPTAWYSRLGFRIDGRSAGFVLEAVGGSA